MKELYDMFTVFFLRTILGITCLWFLSENAKLLWEWINDVEHHKAISIGKFSIFNDKYFENESKFETFGSFFLIFTIAFMVSTILSLAWPVALPASIICGVSFGLRWVIRLRKKVDKSESAGNEKTESEKPKKHENKRKSGESFQEWINRTEKRTKDEKTPKRFPNDSPPETITICKVPDGMLELRYIPGMSLMDALIEDKWIIEDDDKVTINGEIRDHHSNPMLLSGDSILIMKKETFED